MDGIMKYMFFVLIVTLYIGCNTVSEKDLKGKDVVITITYPNDKHQIFINYGEVEGEDVGNYDLVIDVAWDSYRNKEYRDTVLLFQHNDKKQIVRTDTIFMMYDKKQIVGTDTILVMPPLQHK